MKEYKVVELGMLRAEMEDLLNSLSTHGWELKGEYRSFAILERDAGAVTKNEVSAPPPEKSVLAPAPVVDAAAPKPPSIFNPSPKLVATGKRR